MADANSVDPDQTARSGLFWGMTNVLKFCTPDFLTKWLMQTV